MMRNAIVMLVGLLLGAGCGRTDDATNGNYPGEPLFTVHGKLASADITQTPPGLRLALAWMPGLVTSAPVEEGLFSEDLEYTGLFPVDFNFNVYTLPPEKAFVDGGAGSQIAVGALLAYEDSNGDKTLNLIGSDGVVVDRVHGSTFGRYWLYDDRSDFVWIVYVKGAPFQVEGAELAPGFHLLRTNGSSGVKRVDPTEGISIELFRAQRRLDLLACKETRPSDLSVIRPCGMSPAPAGLSVQSEIDVAPDGTATVTASVTNEELPVTSASITLNGKALGYDPASGQFTVTAPASTLLVRGGDNTFWVKGAGQPDRIFATRVPGDFSIVSPTSSTSITAGQPFTVSWTEIAGMQDWTVGALNMVTSVMVSSGGGTASADRGTTSTEIVDATAGTKLLTVSGGTNVGSSEGPYFGALNIRSTVRKTVTITVSP